MKYLLGIDLGTSSVKATLLRTDGRVAGSFAKEYSIDTPYLNWAEQNPIIWWKATCFVIKNLLNKHKLNPKRIISVGLSGQMHGLVLLNKDNNPIRPAIIWPDKRSEKECEEIKNSIDINLLYETTGLPVATGFYGLSLLWVKNNEKNNYKNTLTAILPKDYIRYRLVENIATDASDGSGTLLFNIKKRDWSNEIINLLGLRKSLFPEVKESVDVSGNITKLASLETGLDYGTPVTIGGGDQAIGAIGGGVIEEGTVASVIGTGGQLITSIKNAIFDKEHRTHTLCHALKDSWLLMGAILSGGLSIRWFKDNIINNIYNIDSYDFFSKEAERSEPGSRNLIFLPFLCGERTPYMDPKARGCFIGLSITHTKSDLIRSIMEGVTFAMKESILIFKELGVEIKTLLCSGGGGKSHIWRQIQADIYNMPNISLINDEHSSMGAALLAGVSVGVYKNISEACKQATNMSDIVYPIDKNVNIYEKEFSIYRTLYTLLKTTFKKLDICP